MEYEFKTEAFEGPLDLLLNLISHARIDIQDIFVSEITDQYLQYIRQMEEMDMEVSSEFLTMAATLLHIKSRSLLPRARDEEEEEDPEAALILRLEEYKLIKQAAEHLHELEEEAPKVFYKLPEEFTFQDGPLNLEGIGVQDLFAALNEMLEAREAEENAEERVNVIRHEHFSVREKLSQLRIKLRGGGVFRFTELFNVKSPKGEIIATFLALLELVAAGDARIAQDELFSEITIQSTETQ